MVCRPLPDDREVCTAVFKEGMQFIASEAPVHENWKQLVDVLLQIMRGSDQVDEGLWARFQALLSQQVLLSATPRPPTVLLHEYATEAERAWIGKWLRGYMATVELMSSAAASDDVEVMRRTAELVPAILMPKAAVLAAARRICREAAAKLERAAADAKQGTGRRAGTDTARPETLPDGRVVPIIFGATPKDRAMVLADGGWVSVKLGYARDAVLRRLRDALPGKLSMDEVESIRNINAISVINRLRKHPVLKRIVNPAGGKGDGYYMVCDRTPNRTPNR